MRLQWKYTLIINLCVLVTLVTFYFIDDFSKRQEMNQLHATGVERGVSLKKIAETTIRDTVIKEIERLQAFNPKEIEVALHRLKEEHPDVLDSVVGINVTRQDTRIQACLFPHKNKERYIKLDARYLAEIQQNGVVIDDTPPIDGTYATAMIVPYQADVFPQTDWLLLFRVTGSHREDLDNEIVSEALKQSFLNHKIWLSQDALVSITDPGRQWLVTDSMSGQRYFIWTEGDHLTVNKDQAVIEGPITGYIQVRFEVPDIARFIQRSRLMHFGFAIIVSILLVFIINMTTNRLIMLPLERMVAIIKHAEAGDIRSLPRTYSSDDIGRATSRLVRMLRQLQESHSKRIAALGNFAAGVAHEIRNPLNSIGMTAQHLKELFGGNETGQVSAEDVDEARELLEIVDDEIGQLKRISEQFLTLNRPKSLNLESIQLHELLDRVLSEFTVMMQNTHVTVIKNYDDQLPALQLDPGLIRQTLFNFIQNSIQAMPKGGSIYITTKLGPKSPERNAFLEIRDTGVGMPEEIQERIFDAYFTTKEKEGGMGLGLAISHQIITAHQGQVRVKSKVGMGTAFTISLPVKN